MDFEPASRRRLALAAYLDYLVFGAPWALAVWALTNSVPAVADLPYVTRIVGFLVLEFVLVRQARWSPGSWILSIRVVVPSGLEDASQETFAGRAFVVPSSLRKSERWWTVLLGAFCVLDGAKSIVRWTMFVPPTAILGYRLPDEIAAVALSAMGAIELALAVGVLRLRLYPIAAGAVYYLLFTASSIASWPLIPSLVGEYAHLRRAYQGLEVRPGQVEVLQSFMPYVFVGVPAIMLCWFILVALRARRARADTAA